MHLYLQNYLTADLIHYFRVVMEDNNYVSHRRSFNRKRK